MNNISHTVDYKASGVNIQAGHEAVKRIKSSVETTFAPEVLTKIGGFGALYDLSSIVRNYQEPVLVQSMDGVGTKAIVARMMNHYTTLGVDLVSAATNDIIVMGAKPLTFLDYIANDKLDPSVIEILISGMVKACAENGISLIGGEMAEMPGTYISGEHDLVGVITGVVEKNKIISGKNIKPGDVVLAFASNGLHTNGYSLARKLLFDVAKLSVHTYSPELQCSIGEALLQPHINYTLPVLYLLQRNIPIKGMAHITGGGLLDNIPRILPEGCSVEINEHAWPELALFSMLSELGQLDDAEKYRVFNMGVGLVLIGDPSIVEPARSALQLSFRGLTAGSSADFKEFKLYEIGHVVPGTQKVILT